jgi:hypothetical protein
MLNADTKRAAVEAFLRRAAADPDRPWLVVASSRGHATKVLPGPILGEWGRLRGSSRAGQRANGCPGRYTTPTGPARPAPWRQNTDP